MPPHPSHGPKSCTVPLPHGLRELHLAPRPSMAQVLGGLLASRAEEPNLARIPLTLGAGLALLRWLRDKRAVDRVCRDLFCRLSAAAAAVLLLREEVE